MKRIAFLLSALTLLSGCITQSTAPDPAVLRIGVSPNSQPLIFKQGGQISGIEADYAKLIGEALGKQIRFVEVPWDKQIDSLEQNKTDIIMSGMTITRGRSIRINFATPYMQSGLTGLFRRDAYDPSGLLASTIINQNKRIGYVKGTTSEIFVMQRFPKAEKKSFSSSSAAVKSLKTGKIEMFVYDAPIIWWIFAKNENALVAFPDVLEIEPLAWGVRKNNIVLLEQLNALATQWIQDGTTKKIVENWVPFLGR